MAKFEYTYILFKDENKVFQSVSSVSLTKKDIQEIETFVIDHNYSPEFVDIPGRIYDKCAAKAFDQALKEYPDIADHYDDYELELEQFIPDSIIDQLSEASRQKLLANIQEEYFDAICTDSSTMNHPDEKETLNCSDDLSSESEEVLVPTKENTLYLTIRQTYFDQIVAGTKKKEYREIKDTTYKKYLECDENGNPYYDLDLINADNPLCGDLCIWNDGVYPYIPKDAHEFLNLAVGYNKERDTAIVEITDITFEPLLDKVGNPARFTDNGEKASVDPNGELCFWQIVYHLGRIVEVHRHQ